MFHYHYLPTGSLFEQARPMLTLHKVDLVPTVFGDRPVTHFAHQADIIRLDMLNQYGGIYLDLDVISLASMDHLLENEFVMGQEGIGGSVGLCNAVILARPQARFLQRWQETYRTFDQKDWNYHSVVLPGKLAETFVDEITVLNHTAFFWPLWDSQGLRTLFLEKSYNFAWNYATHIWESAANPHLMAGLTKEVILNVENSLYCQLRYFFTDDDIKPCRLLLHSERSDQLVGYWPLSLPTDKTLLSINPTPAIDESGNDMNGIIRSGYFNKQDTKQQDGVYVSGKDEYIFLSMPLEMTLPTDKITDGDSDQGLTVRWKMKTSDDKQGGTAMMIQTDACKIYIKTGRTTTNEGYVISLGVETWVVASNGWAWERDQELSVETGTVAINEDDQYHDFTLVLRSNKDTSSGSLLVPELALYIDGYVLASQSSWKLPAHVNKFSKVIRGIWFGSAEPAKYQDPWDTRPSLAAWYKDIRVWERPLSIDAIRNDYVKDNDVIFKNADDQQDQLKSWMTDNTLVSTDQQEEYMDEVVWKEEDLL
ncbi:uncharacterized protein BX664DRAFT_278838 [Halteromyces radiatus]|uniref:uncharacterized protein n=1 Tax=Halteromyces radiatus TaxID=101107 RepID=UPI00221E87D3|nr:uncharacterized protein BX664DRAFT_278838 [Halteromyces radiatus]KAI8093711.1 hypothetical protein BX664DRAFT_278838 [Halteromyces radiatus]